MVNVLTVPGWHGSGSGHWQTRWEHRFSNWSRVEQNSWDFPQLDSWVVNLDTAIRASDPPLILVAHSLGCLAIAHWAQFIDPRHWPLSALLVAPPWAGDEISSPPEVQSFLPIPTPPFPFPSILVGSQTDPYTPLDAAAKLASQWGSEFVDAGPVGHINVDSGHGEWPHGEQILSRLLTTVSSSLSPRP